MSYGRHVLAAFLVCAAALLPAPPVRAAPPPAAGLPGPAVPEGWGVNIHFTDPRPGEMARFGEAGYRFARVDFFWSEIERVKGAYDFSAYDRLAGELAKAGARALFILDYGNDLYQAGAPRTPEAVAAFARFAGAAATHFKNKNVVWEIWNEPNLGQFWRPQPDPEQYADLALATAKAVRAADPKATLIAPGASGFPWEFLETVFKRGLLAHLDAVSVHPYRSQNPETAADDFARLRVLIARHAPEGKRDLPIVSSEWGYSTFAPGGVPEAQQARYLARQWLANLASGVNLSIFYDWKDDGDDPKENEHRFGTVRRDLTPKPSFAAAKELIGALTGYTFRHRLAGENKNAWRLLFQKSDTDDLALVTWTADEKTTEAAQTPTVRKVATGDADFLGLRRLAAIHVRQGAFAAKTGEMALLTVTLRNEESNAARVLFHLGKWPLADILTGSQVDLDVPYNPRMNGQRGIDSFPLDLRARWNGQPLPRTAPLIFARTDAIRLSTAPGGDKLAVHVANPAGAPFIGTIVLRFDGKEQSAPLLLASGQTKAVVRLPAPGERTYVVWVRDTKGGEVAAVGPVRNVPLAGFPTRIGPVPGFRQVLFVENVAQKPTPLSVVKTGEGSPAPAALAFRYTFDKGWRYAQAVPTKPAVIPAGASALLVWVRTNDSGDALRARFRDATGQTFQADLGQMTKTEWRLVTIPLDGTHNGVHWSGANDGVPHAPLTWDALILVDSANREVAHTGEVLIAAPVYVVPSR